MAVVYCLNVPDRDRGFARVACAMNRIQMVVVEPRDFDLTVRELTGGLHGHAEGRLFEDTLYLLHNLSQDQFNAFLDALRRPDPPCGGFRAVTTRTNRRWTLQELIEAMKAEQAQLQGKPETARTEEG